MSSGSRNISKNNSVKHNSRKKPSNVVEDFKKGLLEIDDDEEKYDKLFEKKLAQQYHEFRLIKEHHLQIRKFVRIFAVIITIILLALLLLSFTR